MMDAIVQPEIFDPLIPYIIEMGYMPGTGKNHFIILVPANMMLDVESIDKYFKPDGRQLSVAAANWVKFRGSFIDPKIAGYVYSKTLQRPIFLAFAPCI